MSIAFLNVLKNNKQNVKFWGGKYKWQKFTVVMKCSMINAFYLLAYPFIQSEVVFRKVSSSGKNRMCGNNQGICYTVLYKRSIIIIYKINH